MKKAISKAFGICLLGGMFLSIKTSIDNDIFNIFETKYQMSNINYLNKDNDAETTNEKIELMNYDQFKPIHETDKNEQGGVYSHKYNKDNGTFIFDLGANYNQITIDTDVMYNGHFTFYNPGFLGTPDQSGHQSKEKFHLQGTVTPGNATVIGSGSVLTLIDKYGDDYHVNRNFEISMSLNNEGNQLTIFFSNGYGEAENYGASNPHWTINQMYETSADSSEYFEDGKNHWDGTSNSPWDYEDQPSLTLFGTRIFTATENPINIEETQKNFFRFFNKSNFGKPDKGVKLSQINGNYNHPFFTSENTFADVESWIKNNDLIVTETNQKLPCDSLDIVFYDDAHNIINESANLYSTNINFDIFSTNDYLMRGEYLNNKFLIPYIPTNFIYETDEKNIYDLREIPNWIGNITNNYWTYKDGIWQLITNQPFNVIIDSNNFNHIKVKDKTVSSDEDSSYEIDGNVLNGESAAFSHSQLGKNKDERASNFVDKEFNLTTNENYEFNFRYRYSSENYDDLLLNHEGFTSTDDDVIFENKKMELDVNGDGAISSAEIFTANQVTSPFSILPSDDYEEFYGFIVDENGFNFLASAESDSIVYKPGIYLFAYSDEYRNISSELVEYIDEENDKSLSSSKLIDYEGSDRYNEDIMVAEAQGIIGDGNSEISENDKVKFSNLSVHETGAIDYKTNNQSMIDLNNVYINNDKLLEITKEFESETILFKDIENLLNNEIIRQLQAQQPTLLESDVEINWWINGELSSNNEVLIQGDKLTYRINPSQTWNVKNVYGSETGNNNGENSEFIFDGYINLSKLSIDTSTLVDITNSFEQGTKFEKMKPKLESEIKSQLQTKVGDSNKIDIEWNLSDEDSVYYETKINFNISSNWSDIRETYSISFNSSTFFDLKNLEIDNNEIQKLTMNYNGDTFGTVKPVLEEEIMNQMQSKGYRTEFVSIVWFNGDNEIIDFDSIVEYEIVPINSNKVHNTYKGNFHYGIEPVVKNTWLQNLKIYGSIVLSILLLLMIFLFFVAYKIKQKQKKDRRKILENENSLKENELINQIYEETNLLEDKNDDLFMN